MPLAFAQSGETSEYLEQLKSLKASMERIYSDCAAAPQTPRERLLLGERLFALMKTAHGLSECGVFPISKVVLCSGYAGKSEAHLQVSPDEIKATSLNIVS